MTVTIIGVPTNSAGTVDGVARAPGAIRRAGLSAAIADRRADVVDAGDVAVDPPTGTRGGDGVIDATALAATLARVGDAVAAAQPSRVMLLGGDCPILIGGLAGWGAANGVLPALLFVDGHEDAWPAHASTTGEAADMELGWLLGRGLDGLDASLAARIPRIGAERVAVLGPRDRAEMLGAGVEPIDDLVPVVDDRAVMRDPRGAARAALERIAPGTEPWWLHVDLDVLSSSALAAVDYPQPGGLSWSELQVLTEASIDHGGCVGATVTIYNPDLDPDGRSATIVATYVTAIVDRLAS